LQGVVGGFHWGKSITAHQLASRQKNFIPLGFEVVTTSSEHLIYGTTGTDEIAKGELPDKFTAILKM
jgi:hypothetical protein